MADKSKIDNFIEDYLNSITENKAAIFYGAGVSIPSGYPSWKGLLKKVADELDLDINQEGDLMMLAQYYANKELNNKQPLIDLIQSEFTKKTHYNHLMEILSEIPVHTYWTTNYDTELEFYLAQKNRRPFVLRHDSDFKLSSANFTDRIYKFHGDVLDIENCVITRDDYKSYPDTHKMFINDLTSQLTEKTFLFLGYGFQDPDLNDLISTLSTIMHGNMKRHYLIERNVNSKESRRELLSEGVSESKIDYLRKKQELSETDRLKFGIKTIYVDSFDDIEQILDKIKFAFNAPRIFISGSNRKNPNGWTDELVYNFLIRLGEELIENNYKISTALFDGLGALGSGILKTVYEKNLNVDNFLSIKRTPSLIDFPEHSDDEKRNREKYQIGMIESSDIVLFLFGNQFYEGINEPAKGVIEEFELAKKLNKNIIATPQTGGASQQIFKKIEKYTYIKPYVKELRELKITSLEDTNQLVGLILEILNHIHKNLRTFQN